MIGLAEPYPTVVSQLGHDKRGDRNLVKAEAARRLVCLQQGTFWIGTERTLTRQRHYNLVFLHARRKTFPAFADIAEALTCVFPKGGQGHSVYLARHASPVRKIREVFPDD